MKKIDLEKIKREKPIKELLKFSIINLDKPSGPTSFSVSHYIKNKLQLKKTSHFGTLDPQVTGVLPVALNRACKLNEYFMHRNKKYVGIMRTHQEVELVDLKKEMKNFIGKINQLPPVKSRVKRETRVREIVSFEILEKDGKDFLFETEVQAGTYIRKLIHDLGEKIGGAHMLELRRTKAGFFDEKKIYNLYDFDSALESLKNGDESKIREMLTPAEIISEFIPSLFIKDDFLTKALAGSPIFNKSIIEKKKFGTGEKICIFNNDRFVGCYKVVNEKEIFAVPEFVFN